MKLYSSRSPPSTDTSTSIAGMADPANAKRCPSCTLLFLQPGEETGKTRTARVEELLRQNHPPFDVELSDFRQVFEDTQAVLEDLDSKIVQARELLDNLLSARQHAQSRLEDTKAILHPMRSIPDELLAEIFSHCILYSETDSLDPRVAPWLLTRVSRRWRNLAVSLPYLWTDLSLDFDEYKKHISHDQCVYKVCLFAERSRGLPMTVYLGSEDTGNVKDHPVLPVLEASIPRWRYLKVDLPRASLQRLSGNNFLMLQTLSLEYDDEDEWDLNLDVFKSVITPVLRRLEVHHDIPWRALDHVALPWSQLTSITSFPAFDSAGLDRLRTMTDLEELSVLATSAQTPIHNPISLLKLRHLTILESKEAPSRSKEFFSSLTVPALSELTLEYHDESVLHFPTLALPLGNLIKLDITCEMNSHEENTQHILDFLTLTHHVESLRLCDSSITAKFCDGLNLDKIKDGLLVRLPCLRVLDVGDCGWASGPHRFKPFLDMLRSRLPAKAVQGSEETVNADTSGHTGLDGNGMSAPSNETGMDVDPRSGDHRSCLKTLRFPRRLYKKMKQWKAILSELTSQLELECAHS